MLRSRPTSSKKRKDGKERELKINKFTVESKTGKHLQDENAEFELLVKLFIPAKYLVRNNKINIKQLQDSLPVLVSMPKLNLELHLFLSSIVTRYVATWYFRLNTDNMDFVLSLYGMLCDVVKSLASRIASAVDENLFEVVDEFARILDEHLTELWGEETYKVVEEAHSLRNVVKGLSDDEVLQEYLCGKHVIFRHSTSPDSDSINYTPEDPHLVYFRVLTHQIVLATFSDISPGPTTLKISMNIVVFLVADLVLEKVFLLLTQPNFFLLLMQKAVDAVKSRPKPKPRQPWPNVRSVFSKCYASVSAIVLGFSNVSDSGPHILESSVFSLVETITGVALRRPLVYAWLCGVRRVGCAVDTIRLRIDGAAKSFIRSKLLGSPIAKDDGLALVVRSLRESIFEGRSGPPSPPVDPESLANDVGQLINLTRGVLAYKGETPADVRRCIEGVLRVFNHQQLNELLVVQWLDVVVAALYPELSVKAGK